MFNFKININPLEGLSILDTFNSSSKKRIFGFVMA